MNQSLLHIAQTYQRALSQYEEELSTRARELKDCAERFSKQGFKTSTLSSSRRLGWFEELDAAKENLASHKTQIDQSTRLELLTDLGESACRNLEAALQQLQDIAAVKFGYEVAPASPPNKPARPVASPIRSPSAMSDPPTPRVDGLSSAALQALAAPLTFVRDDD